MKKGRNVIGLPVLEQNEGFRLGKVIDVLYAGDNGSILGIMVETEGVSLPEMRFIQLDGITEISEEAVFIADKNGLLPPHCLKNNDQNSFSSALLLGQHIYSELGKEKGVVKDVLLDFATGKVAGYQISNGLLADLLNGRPVIPVGNVITMGKDMIIVRDELE